MNQEIDFGKLASLAAAREAERFVREVFEGAGIHCRSVETDGPGIKNWVPETTESATFGCDVRVEFDSCMHFDCNKEYTVLGRSNNNGIKCNTIIGQRINFDSRSWLIYKITPDGVDDVGLQWLVAEKERTDVGYRKFLERKKREMDGMK